jgi:putative PEP-CTERM system histidine kinase
MPLGSQLVLGTALAGAVVAVLTLAQRSRAAWRYPLAGGLLAVAAELASAAVGQTSTRPESVRLWWQGALACGAFVPAPWLAFGLAFARADAGRAMWRARWLLATAFALPVGLVAFGPHRLLGDPLGAPPTLPYLRLGDAGYLLEVVQILVAVLVLSYMERALRATTGSRRWLIKFLVIGVGSLFAVRIYVSSQSLLFKALDTRFLALRAGAFALAQVSIVVAYVRMRRPVDLYLSPTALYGSFTTLLVAAYLLVVGLLAAVAGRVGGSHTLPFVALMLLGALWLLALALLSDEVRHRLRLLVSRHFRRPVYDYRLEWRRFTQRTGATLDARELCAGIAAWIAETLHLHAVSVWLVEESGAVVLGGSTLRSGSEADAPGDLRATVTRASQALGGRTEPTCLPGFEGLPQDLPEDLRFGLPLRAGGMTVGLVTHSDRATGVALTDEDRELLEMAGEQAASRLLGVRLSERLARAREREAFQALSAFFVHDLKNLASRLSLSLQNLPGRIEDPDFRSDFVTMLSRSVARIDDMCARLSPLTRRLELRLQPEDLAEVTAATLAELKDTLRNRLELHLQPLPKLPCDRGELQKVLTNLVLNADDAISNGGTITVSTGLSGADAFVAVADDGCGMSAEFVETSLFQPFKSTKPKGLGIGLFQTRRIVEAHGGRIEVDSAPGRGTLFRVLLPVAAS